MNGLMEHPLSHQTSRMLSTASLGTPDGTMSDHDAIAYRTAKERFVSDNPGTSAWQVNATSLVSLSGLVLRAALMRGGYDGPVADFGCTVAPLLLGMTACADRVVELNGALVVAAAVAWLILPASRPPPSPKDAVGGNNNDNRHPYIAIHRAQMMIMTILAILAVDFPIFPRSFGKTEMWGTSLVSATCKGTNWFEADSGARWTWASDHSSLLKVSLQVVV